MMTQKSLTYTLSNSIRHCDEVTKNNNSDNKRKTTSYIFPSKMIAKLEMTQNAA